MLQVCASWVYCFSQMRQNQTTSSDSPVDSVVDSVEPVVSAGGVVVEVVSVWPLSVGFVSGGVAVVGSVVCSVEDSVVASVEGSVEASVDGTVVGGVPSVEGSVDGVVVASVEGSISASEEGAVVGSVEGSVVFSANTVITPLLISFALAGANQDASQLNTQSQFASIVTEEDSETTIL